MKLALIILCLYIGACTASTEATITEDEEETTSWENEGLNKTESEDSESPEVQKKRESGYKYNRPTRLPVNYRPSSASRLPYRRKPHSRRPSHPARPFTQYGLPMKNVPIMHQGFVPSTGLLGPSVPNPVRTTKFEEPNPIASQNFIPFGRNTALYLPPNNQRPPSYSPPSVFSSSHQNFVQEDTNSQQISDAAYFLTQNAQAISELYKAPASNQEYAPAEEAFEQNNQLQHQNDARAQLASSTQASQEFSGQLPAYANGILSNRETLEKIQSFEKDRLILQLQQALADSRNTENERLNQEAANFQNSLLGSGGVSEVSYTYGVPTQPPSSAPSPVPSHSPSPSEPTNPIESPLSPQQPPGTSQGFPHYSGFLPSVVSSANIPGFNPGFIGLGSSSVPIKPIDVPTHFGIPLPDQKPSLLPDLNGVSHVTPLIPARPTSPSLQVHPVPTPIQPIRPIYPAPAPPRPVVPVNPVTSIQPDVTPIIAHQGHAFGIHPTSTLNYKPLKAVYPFYYSGHKAALPVQPWL